MWYKQSVVDQCFVNRILEGYDEKQAYDLALEDAVHVMDEMIDSCYDVVQDERL